MKITIVTLVNNESVDSFVGAIARSLTEEERHALALSYESVYKHDWDTEEDDGPAREMCFREVDLADDPKNLTVLDGIDDDNPFARGALRPDLCVKKPTP